MNDSYGVTFAIDNFRAGNFYLINRELRSVLETI